MNVNEGLRDLLTDEPPFVLRPDEAVSAGRRRRRRRVAGTAMTAGAAAVVTVGSFALLAPSSTSKPATVRFGGTPTSASSTDTGDTSSVYYRIARAHTPDGWSIRDGYVDHISGFWADVDDGVHGPGRLGLFRSTGGLQQHPCSDSEFVAKADTCKETILDADTRLIVRGVSQTNPINDVQVVIVHGDGSGVNVSDDNATWPKVPERRTVFTEAEKRALNEGTIGSPEPLYSLDTLVAMAKALDAASS